MDVANVFDSIFLEIYTHYQIIVKIRKNYMNKQQKAIACQTFTLLSSQIWKLKHHFKARPIIAISYIQIKIQTSQIYAVCAFNKNDMIL